MQRHKGGYIRKMLEEIQDVRFVIEDGGRGKKFQLSGSSKNSSSSLFKIGGRGENRGREKAGADQRTVQKKRYSTNRMAVRLNAKLFSAGETKEGRARSLRRQRPRDF